MNDRKMRRAVLLLIGLFLLLGVLLVLVIRPARKHEEMPVVHVPPPPAAVESTGHVAPAEVAEAPDTLPVRQSVASVHPAPPPPAHHRLHALESELGVYEFIRDFYGDVRERTVTVLLRSARLDSAGSGTWLFRPGPSAEETLPVRRFFIAVDSVHPLCLHIFPGWGYGSDWVPLPDGSIGLEGEIAPKAGSYRLTHHKEEVPPWGGVERKDDRLSVYLRSVPGYSYVLRLGLECIPRAAGEPAETLYTQREAVEFPHVVHCGMLAQEVRDTLFLASDDPAAVREVAATVPNAPIVAVLLGADPDAGWTRNDFTSRKDVSVLLNSTTPSRESFVILNGSKALVERRETEPAFDRILRSHLGSGLASGAIIEDDPARPVLRRTDLLDNPDAVASLMIQFRMYVRDSQGRL